MITLINNSKYLDNNSMNQRKDIVRNKLKEYRIKAGLTQMNVTTKLNLQNSQNRISRWEAGIAIPSLQNLKRLSRLYKTKIENLFPDY
jgi:transcriptional regulator with XRE-family HTH domain